MTALKSKFGVNNIVLVNNRSMQLGIKDVLKYYIEHQVDVITRRTQFDLKKAQDRAHILEGLMIAIKNIDEVIRIIRQSPDASVAQPKLMETFHLSDIQAKAILDMQFRRLTGLEIDKILAEHNDLQVIIADLLDILSKHERILEIIKTELIEVKNKFNDERRSEIIEGELDVQDEDLIPVQDIMISMTVNGYIKRIPIDTYKLQNRGGRGVKGMTVNEEDIIDQCISMSTHDYLMLFTNKGRVYRIKGYRIPESSRQAKGLPVVNLLNLEKDEKVKTLVAVKRDDELSKYLFFVTKKGLVKRTSVDEFENIRQTGKIAISLKEDDELIAVKLTSGNDQIIIANSNGKAVRFDEDGIRPSGRVASGVKGMNVDGGNVIGIATSSEGNYILVVSEKGYGKKSDINEYRETSRGAKGVKTINVTDKNGDLVSLKAVNGDEDCMIMTDDGIVIRISLEKVSTLGRLTQGVRLIKPSEGSIVSTVVVVDKIETDDQVIIEEEV